MSEDQAATEDFERAVINSALWAAAGDALGWITELSRGSEGVKVRAGVDAVSEPVAWKRMIGGRNGVKVDLPAGTYSDDTQLRLGVSRSIRGNGVFDVEAFAKVELTVWPTFALGGGLGTKAAALNLSRRGVNWFSNFFDSGGQKYVNGGGNGAAMRIQPHVWSSLGDTKKLAHNVLRDALVTHGHPHGFCGAVFHALVLSETLKSRAIPEPRMWAGFIERFTDLANLIAEDSQLSAFWRSAWESGAGKSLDTALSETRNDALQDLDQIVNLIGKSTNGYHEILDRLGCLTPRFRGSGFKTSLASLALAYSFRNGDIEKALVTAANELESDTDTIATMTGAILGAISVEPPKWAVQDRGYIVQEAKRMAAIALRKPQDSFSYPDLSRWIPPSTQIASVGLLNGGLAIVGLGTLEPKGKAYTAGDAVWQWFSLPFGQTILAKRRANMRESITVQQLPGPRQNARIEMSASQKIEPANIGNQTRLPLEEKRVQNSNSSKSVEMLKSSGDALDRWTDEVIQSDFDDLTLGRLLNLCIDSSQSIEVAVGFASIVTKAKLARQRRRR